MTAEHGMIPGSHERAFGPECRCGQPYDYWGGRCLTQAREKRERDAAEFAEAGTRKEQEQ